MAAATELLRVYVETGKTRVFACALDWPGWCRSGRSDLKAVNTLVDYAARYRSAVAEAGIELPAGMGEHIEIVERLQGNATTDWGSPGIIATEDVEPLTPDEAERLAAIVAASWRVFDRIAGGAPLDLRKGPRGGGRDRDTIVGHILGADVEYAKAMGLRLHAPDPANAAEVAAFREAILAVIRASRGGPASTPKGWPIRFAARRITWHALDHAWEIEDRS